jgi:universal stress protein E
MAARIGGELHAGHAFFPASLLAATAPVGGLPLEGGLTVTDVIEAESRRIADALASIAGAHAIDPGRVHLEQGSAVEVLPRVAASLSAALVVMGAVSRSRLQEVVLGSTAERVLDRIGCDVLVVKPGDFAEKLPF